MGGHKFKEDNKQVFIPNLIAFFASLLTLVLFSIPVYESGLNFVSVLLVAWVGFCFFITWYLHCFLDIHGTSVRIYSIEESDKKQFISYILRPKLMMNDYLHFNPTNILVRPLISPYCFFNLYTFIPLLGTAVVCEFIRLTSYVLYGDFHWGANLQDLMLYAILAQAVSLYVLNLVAIAKVLLSKTPTQEQKQSYVNTEFSEYELLSLINKADLEDITQTSKLNKRFRKFVGKTYTVIRKLNKLISTHPQYATVFTANSDYLQYIVNDIVPMKTQTAIDIASSNDQSKEDAIAIINNRIGYDLLQQINLLETEVNAIEIKIDEIFEDIDSQIRRGFLEGLEDTFTINPLNYFPDFYTLKFEELENEVFAKNILNETLPNLIKAREGLTDNADIAKINKQIDDVKHFVRSIASNSPESKQRALRHSQEQSKDILNIGHENHYMSDLDYLIGSTSRYLESADKSLPLRK